MRIGNLELSEREVDVIHEALVYFYLYSTRSAVKKNYAKNMAIDIELEEERG